MSIQHVSNRLSLRTPQRDSLEILDRICEIIELSKDADLATALTAIQKEFPTVEEFEREFPSLCFAIATGVGKTRLMGAFIAYLYLAKGIRNFFVLAPNLTIYKKLIADFTPNTPKYVFKGIGEFAVHPPLVVTGDTYEDGRGVRRDDQLPGVDWGHDVHINIFNISKISSEVRGGNAPRIKRLSEYIGQSYFDYLAGLDDLVMLMDESHRYRATAGVRAINELKPILGLELTATPKEPGGNDFKNVIYSYPLSSAMTDGFVKEPAVATRENFDPNAYSPEGLEKVKLEDGVRIHENTKVELEVYSRNNDKPIVKPFMLVVATDTTHANALQQVIEGDTFFEGRYKGKVIQVHSKVRGEEYDEVIQQLLTVEHADNPVEIVIHVNMLKEGWDVTNLYTIVPLRAANSRILVEQCIGRGLRLPYGKRVGVPAVDRLTIVSHDKFQEIVDHANDPDSIIRAGVVIGRDIPEAGRKAVEVKSAFEHAISGGTVPARPAAAGQPAVEQRKLFEKPEEQAVAKATYQVIKQYERLKGSDQLQDSAVQAEIVQKVQEIVRPAQGMLEGINEVVNVAKVVLETTELYQALSIDVPKIVVVPKGEVTCGYEDFDLEAGNINLQPVAQDILIQYLHENQRYRLQDGSGIVQEKRPEDYLVRGLIDFDDVSYDEHAALLYKLAGQVVARLRSYLSEEDDVINVLQFHQQALVNLIHAQMQQHYVESASAYEAHVTRGFHTLRANNYSAAADENVRDFRATIPEGQRNRIGTMVFGGFGKCLYPIQKFDSDPERRFAVILENDANVLKWFKPAKGDFQIHYSHEESYEPDFVVETTTEKFLCEPKRANEMTDEVVLAKADAAATWSKHATSHANENGGKPWRYLLIPHDQIQDQMTLAGLAARHEVRAKG
ncbi:MAG: DEAD/DEAH box helicase family protein [Kiritimatiellae bacterium]|nr:DEAD/DEAH box helicase family protein [Kiritimatiellia bacterium]